MRSKNARTSDIESDGNGSLLHEVRMAVIGYSMRGNIFGQFGRILTQEKKQLMKANANKIDAQAHINKLLSSKKINLG